LGSKIPRSIFLFGGKYEFNSRLRMLKKYVLACEAGAGSSLMVKNGLNQESKKSRPRGGDSSCSSNTDSK
jgi:methylglyoxal synthase